MDRLAAGLRRSPELIPGGLATIVFVALAASEGGFAPTTWYPAALFVLGLLAVCAVGLRYGMRLRLSDALRVALIALIAFTAWSFLSMTWADVPATAWDGANRTLLYLLVFALFVVQPWRASTGALLLAAHSVAIAVLAFVTLGDLASSDDPLLGLIHGRLVEPTGYQNATAALLLASFFPALLLASRREIPWWARGVLLAAAGVLLEVAILPQSRGSVVALPIVALLFVALAPGRARLLLVGAPVGVAALFAHQPLFDLYSVVVDGGDVTGAFDDAYRVVVLSAIGLLVFGTALGLVERSVTPPAKLGTYAARASGLTAGVAAVVAVVVALNATGNPITWADERWEDFKSGDPGQIGEDTRFGGTLGSNRYDFWRVAMDRFGDDPLIGIGVEQFEVDYVRERESDEEPSNPHSLEVRIVSQTGIVGSLLFAGFLVAGVAGALRARRRGGDSLAGAVAAAGLTSFAYWFVHGSGDWFWEFPGLSAPVFAWLAISGALDPGESGEDEGATARRRTPFAIGGAILAAVVAVSLLLPWAAARDVEIAAEHWPADPDAAFERLDRARGLNPLSDEADSVAGTIAIRLDDPERAEAAFLSAADRNAHSWYTQLMLGTLQATGGDRRVAIGHLQAALALTPQDPLVQDALRRAREGRPLTAQAIDRALILRVCSRVGRTAATQDCE